MIFFFLRDVSIRRKQREYSLTGFCAVGRNGINYFCLRRGFAIKESCFVALCLWRACQLYRLSFHSLFDCFVACLKKSRRFFLQIYRKCYGEHVGFKMFSDALLISFTRKMMLPDMEFMWNLGDWPLSKKHKRHHLPIFSWCGSEDTDDIVLPTYELTESVLEMMGRISMDIFSVISQSLVPWKDKVRLCITIMMHVT